MSDPADRFSAVERASSPDSEDRTWRRRALLIAAISVGCFVAAVAILFLTTGDSSDGESTAAADLRVGEPAIVSEEELRAFAGDQAVPVYWAGPRRPSAYELTRTDDGRVFIRYLPEGANPGDPSPRFLTVASYAQPNAYRFLRAQSRRDGWSGQRTGSGALVAYADRRPTSVYFAFADADLQVEVYDPDSGVARSLVLEGEIRRLR